MHSLEMGPLIATRIFFAVGAATLGAAAAVLLKKISHLGLCVLISFAAGSLLAVTFLDIVPEAIHMIGPVKGILSFISGYALFLFLTRFVYHVCPACAATHTEVKFRALSTAMIVALSIHSFMDGLAIYSGSISGETTGLLILFAVAFHKFPEGMALSLVGLNSGLSRPVAFLVSFSVEMATTVAGGFAGGLLHVSESSPWIGIVLAHVGGGFLFIVWHALLSEVVKHHPKHTILAAAFGAAMITAFQFIQPH